MFVGYTIYTMRKRLFFILLFSMLLAPAVNLNAQDGADSVLSFVQKFIGTLSQVQQKMAMHHFADTARIKWNNLPVGLRARAGISVGAMTDEQRRLLHRVLSSSLSSQGYLKATSIMHLDNLLNIYYDTLYQRKAIDSRMHGFLTDLKWSHQNFYFAIFGVPGRDSTWSYKLEGHHLSLNFTFTKDKLSVTPLFVGTDPAEYPILEYAGWRVLAFEEDYGIKLINSLSKEQLQKATVSKQVPSDIITAAESGRRLVDYWGIPFSELNQKQQKTLLLIMREFVYNLEFEKAESEYRKIVDAGLKNIYFGWIGSFNEHEPHYFIINGPTFIIEFDNNDGPGRMANHIHAIWREKGNEYGEDVLKLHLKTEH